MGVNWKITVAALVLAIGVQPALAQDDMSDVEIKTIPVAGGIYMLMGRGGNIGLSTGDDKAFLIDDQFAPLTDKILAAVAKVTDQPVQFVVNTHWHFDHTGGNENLGNAGTVIVAHDNVRKRMSVRQVIKAINRDIPAAPGAALPVITFDRSLSLHVNGDEARVIHVAHAHTDGDAIIHFVKSNVIHMGDTYFAGRFPFIDLGSGGSIDGLIAAVEVGLGLADENTRIIPGHGPLSNAKELADYGQMLRTARDRIAAAVADGASLDDVIAAKPLADLDATWGGGFIAADRFVKFVYTGVGGSAE